MRQSGHWADNSTLDEGAFRKLLSDKIDTLDVNQARREVEPFVRHPEALEIWSTNFFHDIGSRIKLV